MKTDSNAGVQVWLLFIGLCTDYDFEGVYESSDLATLAAERVMARLGGSWSRRHRTGPILVWDRDDERYQSVTIEPHTVQTAATAKPEGA